MHNRAARRRVGVKKAFQSWMRIRFGRDLGQGCIRWLDSVEDVEDCGFAQRVTRIIDSRCGVMQRVCKQMLVEKAKFSMCNDVGIIDICRR